MAMSDLSTLLRARLPLWPALAFAASAVMLATAWGFQLIGGVQPCTLCIYQRWPYWVVLGIAGLALLTARKLGPRGVAAIAALCAVIFLAGGGIAGFHVGVEQHWWEGLSTCGGGLNDPNMSLDELRTRLFATSVVHCDDVPWSLFGISMAGFNFIASLVFGTASLWAARTIGRSAT